MTVPYPLHWPEELPRNTGSRPWWAVLGVAPTATRDAVQAAYKVRARRAAERDDGQLQEINVARDRALAALAAQATDGDR